MSIAFDYPPDLLNMLIEAIPVLCRSKRDVLLFFQGAGVPARLTDPMNQQLRTQRDSLSKYEIARTVLTQLSVGGDSTLRERREVLRRVTEFSDFSVCWSGDQWKAKGLVADIRRFVEYRDSITRLANELEADRSRRREEQRQAEAEKKRKSDRIASVKSDLFALFNEKNAQTRGKSLERVLNGLFDVHGLSVRESFTLVGSSGEGIVEQIDGVVEIDGALYLVELKWWNEPLGVGEVSQHLVRVFNRGHARGIFISASGYTNPAILTCKESLQRTVVVLCKLEEVVKLLEREFDLGAFLKQKIQVAVIDKNPLFEPLQ